MEKVIVFTAPSGAGKTTIVHRMLNSESRLVFSVSATTRPQRDYETHGKDYHFLTAEDFKNKINAGAFIEWEEVYPGIFYGTLAEEVSRLAEDGKTVVFDIDVHGAMNIKKKYGDNALTIFVRPPDLNVLRQRLMARKSESDDTLTKRLERAGYEMGFEHQFDYIVVNAGLETAVIETRGIIGRFLDSTTLNF